MKYSLNKTLIGIACALSALLVSTPAWPEYPDRPIRIVEPVTAGGTVDIITRIFAEKLQEAWGQSVLVENRSGGAGVPAVLSVTNAKPDGSTLLMATIGTAAVNPHLMKKPPYDPQTDLVPISLVAKVPGALVVASSSPFKSIQDLIAFAKANPGQLTFGSSGNGTSSHIAAELLKQRARLDIRHVPYPGGAQVTIDLLAGRIDMYFDNIINALPNLRSGKLRALAVTTVDRSTLLPDTPSIADSGVPGYEVTGWVGLMAPSGTPRAIIDRIESEVRRIANMPDVRSKVVGADIVGSSSDEFRKFLGSENARWRAVVTAAKLPLN